uniref:Uncharacterized protein n=1 Tax=Salmonella sp. TaxID=599 RepID=A0A482ETB6_SALSP|nr:hypothetical protein NNIBIDOC_00103 [Salmonella sp.]
MNNMATKRLLSSFQNTKLTKKMEPRHHYDDNGVMINLTGACNYFVGGITTQQEEIDLEAAGLF